MGEIVDLVQTHTSMANDMAGNGIQNGESHSDAWLIHRGDGVDCLLGVACRHWHSVGVPVTMRRVGPRSCQGPRGSRRSWGRGGSLPHEEGDEHRVITDGLTEVLTNRNKLLMREGSLAHRHSREGQSRRWGGGEG